VKLGVRYLFGIFKGKKGFKKIEKNKKIEEIMKKIEILIFIVIMLIRR